jgi:hypothetical protein
MEFFRVREEGCIFYASTITFIENDSRIGFSSEGSLISYRCRPAI